MDIGCKLERTPCSLGQIDVPQVCSTLGNAQSSSLEFQFLPSPMGHRSKRRILAWVRRDIPQRQEHELNEAVPLHTQGGHFAVGIMELRPNAQESVMVVN